ncbi:phage tail sheath family protein [Granulicella sibirica]|uniref:Phage tail sheath protein FI n=1 Tax=Granulicella sibirica TaxID=2479048 RepID=A0A4Q0T3H7_9BACT|nr:phage tail sheath C-terminal domain-containing protein [Granulicella sibirica]RXH56529.1 Phage tail sheath protein FI [Granulicella sibirica]
MPVMTSYPGVYVQEIPSGVHTIAGVATSIAAFVGWAPQGPTTSAGLVLSWSDYNRLYGGLDTRSLLGYAVSQFFINGGQQAYIVRIAGSDAKASVVAIGGVLSFTAKNPGAWASNYAIATKKQTADPTRFRVQVVYAPPGALSETVVESYENLSMVTPDPQGRYVLDVINKQSSLVQVVIVGGATAPPADTPLPTAAKPLSSPPLAGGADGAVLAPSTNSAAGGAFETALFPATPGTGVPLLDQVDLFNLLCIPGEIVGATLSTAETFCEGHRAILICDSDPGITDYTKLQTGPPLTGTNSAFYFPWILAPDPLNQNRPASYPPCGFVAGLYARTDTNRGVWKAPAGTEASLAGVSGVAVPLNDKQNGVLNPVAVNCIRNFSVYGTVIWGARTTAGNDELGSEWKYVPVRRTALFIEESLYRALKWAVFEPNDSPLWAELRLNVGSFMQNLFRQGAFQGTTPTDAYFVKCDGETTTQNDINLGIVNVLVGFAPLKPAEFVVIQIQQIAGQIAT